MENIISSLFAYSKNNGTVSKNGMDHVIIIICTDGKAEIELDSRSYSIEERIFITIAPGKQYCVASCSKDFRADMYNLRLDLLPIDELKHAYSLKSIYDDKPRRKIPEEKYIMCRFIGQYLKNFQYENENIYQLQILKSYLNILFYEALNIFLNDNEKKHQSKKKYLTDRFLADVEDNFKNQRKISFYARKLGITPKYLSTLVSKETGRSASGWIEEYTLLEAMKLLREGKMTIYQVAYELSFSTPSHFGTFFRKHTGKTPKEFIRANKIISHNEASPPE